MHPHTHARLRQKQDKHGEKGQKGDLSKDDYDSKRTHFFKTDNPALLFPHLPSVCVALRRKYEDLERQNEALKTEIRGVRAQTAEAAAAAPLKKRHRGKGRNEIAHDGAFMKSAVDTAVEVLAERVQFLPTQDIVDAIAVICSFILFYFILLIYFLFFKKGQDARAKQDAPGSVEGRQS